MKANNNISEARRAYSKRNGVKFTQEDAAREFGVSLSAYRNYEQEVNLPNAGVIARMAEKYGVSVEYLLCTTNDPRPHMRTRADLSVGELEVVDLFGKMNAKQRAAIIDTMRAMVG